MKTGFDESAFADVIAWLKAGSPPIFVGFGSMVIQDPKALAAIIMEAAEASARRGVGGGAMPFERCHLAFEKLVYTLELPGATRAREPAPTARLTPPPRVREPAPPFCVPGCTSFGACQALRTSAARRRRWRSTCSRA